MPSTSAETHEPTRSNLTGTTIPRVPSFVGFPPAENYGPITSIFTPASSCARFASQSDVPFEIESTLVIAGGHPDCYPGTRLYQSHYGIMEISSFYYSPAFFCPHGYTTATTWDPVYALAFSEQPKLDSSESAYFCCPSSYDFGKYGNCFSQLAQGQVITNERLVDFSWIEGPETTVDESMTISAMAWSIQIRYHNSDLARCSISSTATSRSSEGGVFSAASTSISAFTPTSTLTSTSASASAFTSPSTPTAEPPPLPNSQGLSPATKAAIGIATPLVCVTFFLGIFFFFRRRKRAKQGMARPLRVPPTVPTRGPGISWRAEMDEDSSVQRRARVDSLKAVELDSRPIL